jgi:hypothetical protein
MVATLQTITAIPIKIQTSTTSDKNLLGGLKYWCKYQRDTSAILLYQGNDMPTESQWINYMSWKNIDSLA